MSKTSESTIYSAPLSYFSSLKVISKLKNASRGAQNASQDSQITPIQKSVWERHSLSLRAGFTFISFALDFAH